MPMFEHGQSMALLLWLTGQHIEAPFGSWPPYLRHWSRADFPLLSQLSLKTDAKPPRSFAESGFATFKDVTDRLADRCIF